MTKRAYPSRFAVCVAAALLCSTASARMAWSETIDGRYAGTFGCTQSGPIPEFTAPVAADIVGGKFTMSRHSRFGPESFTGTIDGDGKASIEGGGRGEMGGQGTGEWKYELNGALDRGRIEAKGRMYTRRDANRRICALSLARVGAGPGGQELAARQKQDQESAVRQAQEAEARRAAEAEAQAQAQAHAQAQAQALAQAQAQARQEAEQRQKLEAELRARQQADAKAKAEMEAKAKAEADARAKQLADAKAKADAEAKMKAEADAKAKQLAEAKAKAEAEAKAKAEADAKAQQLAEAKIKADAEAKAKAEADARAKQLAEAKAKADAEAKAKAEAEAKAARERQELEDRLRLAEQRAKDAEDKAKQEAEARRTAQTAPPIVTAAVAPPPSVAPPAQAGRATMIPQASDLVFSKPGAEQRIALVIGNSGYQHAPRLDNPQTDARAMAAALLKTGFELIGGGAQLDLDKPKLERAIHEFSRRLRQGTVGMFYYAGHGFEVGGRNYLAPIDANPTSTRDIDFMLVDVDLLLRQLRDADSRLNMVVLDACRNNPFGGAGLRGGGGLAEIKSRPSGTIISFATAAGEVARDGPPGQNSPYTAALVAAILKPGLSVLDTFNDVAISVQRATNREQQPWIQSTGIQGQFFFVPPVGGAPSVTPAAASSPGAMDRDALFWSSVKDSRDPAQLQAYLTQFPDGVYAPLARIWIEDAKRAAKPKP